MKANKMVVAALSLALSLSMVACNKKENTPANGDKTTTEQNTADTTNNANNDYVEKYSRFYGDTLGNLGNYRMYETPEATTEYYKTNQYPGNEKYVEELKAAYKDSRTDDKEISDMNQKLIAEGEKTISNIDARLKNLDNLPKDIYSKSQDDFIRAVDEATKVKDNTTNDFNNLLDEMNKALGINPNAMQNPGTMSNTNKNTNTDTKK